MTILPKDPRHLTHGRDLALKMWPGWCLQLPSPAPQPSRDALPCALRWLPLQDRGCALRLSKHLVLMGVCTQSYAHVVQAGLFP